MSTINRELNGKKLYLRVLKSVVENVSDIITFAYNCDFTQERDGKWIDFHETKMSGMLLVVQLKEPDQYMLVLLNRNDKRIWKLSLDDIDSMEPFDSSSASEPDAKSLALYTSNAGYCLLFKRSDDALAIINALERILL